MSVLAPAPPRERLVGAPVRRREDFRVLRGQTRYLDDLELPRMAHVAFVRSPLAHARITAVRPPQDAPGLLAVYRAADLEGRVHPLDPPKLAGAEIRSIHQPALAADEVCYVGQPVAMVVAASRAVAEDIAELVEVDYEPLPTVVDAGDADEHLLRWSHAGGDVEGAFAAADHVVRSSHALPRLAAAPMETRGAIAAHDAGTDLLTVWCSAQDPHRPLRQLTQALRRPADAIRVVVPDVGGAFGSKGVLGVEVFALAIAAMDLGRPLKWAEDRLENLLGAHQGRGERVDLELALSADGRFLGLRADVVADLGAYLLPSLGVPAHNTAILLCGCYDVPAAEVRITGARTHKVPVGPYRGAGRPEAAYAIELAVDTAARELGLDPIELRRRNLVRAFPHRTPLGWTYDSGDYARCLDVALELLGERPAPTSDDAVQGRGVILYVERAGGQWEGAAVTVTADARVIVRSSSTPHGQGHETTFAQIVADRLGVPPGDVILRFGDSALVPAGIGTFGARSLTVGGSAIVRALDALIDTARPIAARVLDRPVDEVGFKDGAFVAGQQRASFAAVAAAAHDLAVVGPGAPGLEAQARFRGDFTFPSGAYAADVEIDRATGQLRIQRLVAVDDAGRIVNPLLAEGQVIGACVQGLGEMLSEEVVHDEDGQVRSASFMDYALLTAADVPPIVAAFVESPSPTNPLGAKGVGEAGTVGTPAVLACAVADALGGPPPDPPFTPERLWHALRPPEERP
jgi:carbon-monoxide dehydrogenase large subunit